MFAAAYPVCPRKRQTGDTILSSAIGLIPRLRRFGRLMVADADRADSLLLDALRACRDRVIKCGDDPACVARILFGAAICSFESDARGYRGMGILPKLASSPIPLLPAFWALPYDERLAINLLHVECFSPDLAARICGVTPDRMKGQADTGIRRLAGHLPFLSPH